MPPGNWRIVPAVQSGSFRRSPQAGTFSSTPRRPAASAIQATPCRARHSTAISCSISCTRPRRRHCSARRALRDARRSAASRCSSRRRSVNSSYGPGSGHRQGSSRMQHMWLTVDSEAFQRHDYAITKSRSARRTRRTLLGSCLRDHRGLRGHRAEFVGVSV